MFEKFSRNPAFNWLRTTPQRMAAWCVVNALNAGIDATDTFPRGALPEPFDVGNHLGNVNTSIQIGVVAGGIISYSAERLAPRANPRVLRGAIFAGATAAGALINGLTEYKYGQQLIGEDILRGIFDSHVVGDPLDAAYGTIAAGAASSFVVGKSSHAANIATR